MLVFLVAGCADDRGPVDGPTASVAGRVTVGGRPLRGGFLELLPVDGTVGRLRSAPIGPDGRFATRGVAAGINAIRIVGPRPYDPRLHPLTQAHRIRRTILAGRANALEIELLAEAAGLGANRGR